MNWVTLIVWLVAALGGFTLVGIWLREGGWNAVVRRFPKPLPMLHALAAVVSLVLFLVWWAEDVNSLKYITLIGLLLTAVLGIAMFVMWIAGLRAPTAPAMGADVARAPEDRFPVPLVALHGVAAVATLVLYIVAAFIVAS